MSATDGASFLVDPAIIPSALSRSAVRVCLVSVEFNGPNRNGGIGTACTSLGVKLAAAGHEVTFLHVREQPFDPDSLHHWEEYFASSGVRFVSVTAMDSPGSAGWLALSRRVADWLAEQESGGSHFDVLHFHEWLGLGYCSLRDRQKGKSLRGSMICVGLHSPSRWIQQANQQPLDRFELLHRDSLERQSAEWADVVWSPSRYLLDWVQQRGWNVRDRGWVHPYPVPLSPLTGAIGKEPLPVRELVFFGRLEVRKGLILFCDALDRLSPADLPVGFRVMFLGRPTLIQGLDATVYLKNRSRAWPFPIEVLPGCDHDDALEHVRQSGRLAVMPSLMENSPLTVIESLALGVPLLASAVGGIPELIDPECHATHLFEPRAEALAERLRAALREGVPIARPLHDAASIDQTWDQWHRNAAKHRRLRTEAVPRASSPGVPDLESLNVLASIPQEDLLELIEQQARRIEELERDLTMGATFLRHRLADAIYQALGYVPLLRPLLRRLVRLGFRLTGRTPQ